MDFSAIHSKADAAGKAAASAHTPTPMHVSNGKTVYTVMDGPCGFAWIAFAGNTPWGRWAKKMKLASSHYPKGLCIWVSAYSQSMELKEAYARGYAAVLKEFGIDAYAGSRMD